MTLIAAHKTVQASATGADRTDGPGWLPGPAQGVIDREPLWHRFACSRQESEQTVPPWFGTGDPSDSATPPAPDLRSLLRWPGPGRPWPQLRAPLSHSRFGEASSSPGSLVNVLVDALAPLRTDPNDPYNDHRGYASPRCLFPVHALCSTEQRWWAADPDGRALVDTRVAAPGPDSIALVGRPASIPKVYQWFRGTLVSVETGILLRHLAVLATHHGIRLAAGGPDPDWTDRGAPAVWRQERQWSAPVLVRSMSAPKASAAADGRDVQHVPVDVERAVADGVDPSLDSTTRWLRDHPLPPASAHLGSGIPAGLQAPTQATWSQVLYDRSAGRMPRGLFGFRVAPAPLAAVDVEDQGRWAVQPAPFVPDDAFTLRALVNCVEGVRPGVHRWRDGRLHWERPAGPADFVAAYGYPSTPEAGNGLGDAPLVWFVSCRPRTLVERDGPAAWNALQIATGWITHGLCLAAATQQLLARPVRAFDERRLSDVLPLAPDEMVSMAVVVGKHHRHGGLQIDLRM